MYLRVCVDECVCGRECVCVCVWPECVLQCVCVCVCVCVCERVGAYTSVCVSGDVSCVNYHHQNYNFRAT